MTGFEPEIVIPMIRQAIGRGDVLQLDGLLRRHPRREAWVTVLSDPDLRRSPRADAACRWLLARLLERLRDGDVRAMLSMACQGGMERFVEALLDADPALLVSELCDLATFAAQRDAVRTLRILLREVSQNAGTANDDRSHNQIGELYRDLMHAALDAGNVEAARCIQDLTRPEDQARLLAPGGRDAQPPAAPAPAHCPPEESWSGEEEEEGQALAAPARAPSRLAEAEQLFGRALAELLEGYSEEEVAELVCETSARLVQQARGSLRRGREQRARRRRLAAPSPPPSRGPSPGPSSPPPPRAPALTVPPSVAIHGLTRGAAAGAARRLAPASPAAPPASVITFGIDGVSAGGDNTASTAATSSTANTETTEVSGDTGDAGNAGDVEEIDSSTAGNDAGNAGAVEEIDSSAAGGDAGNAGDVEEIDSSTAGGDADDEEEEEEETHPRDTDAYAAGAAAADAIYGAATNGDDGEAAGEAAGEGEDEIENAVRPAVVYPPREDDAPVRPPGQSAPLRAPGPSAWTMLGKRRGRPTPPPGERDLLCSGTPTSVVGSPVQDPHAIVARCLAPRERWLEELEAARVERRAPDEGLRPPPPRTRLRRWRRNN